jgi:di/tricarboxylate transporter
MNAALLATGAMLMTGCLTIQRAWDSVDWRTVLVLGAAVGLEPALTSSGLSSSVAQLLSSIGGNSPTFALAAVFFAAVIAKNTIGHAAAAVFMFPVALSIATTLGVSFMPFAITLMRKTTAA